MADPDVLFVASLPGGCLTIEVGPAGPAIVVEHGDGISRTERPIDPDAAARIVTGLVPFARAEHRDAIVPPPRESVVPPVPPDRDTLPEQP